MNCECCKCLFSCMNGEMSTANDEVSSTVILYLSPSQHQLPGVSVVQCRWHVTAVECGAS